MVQITNTNLTPSKTYKVYHDCETDTGTATNLVIAAADPTNPRIDIVCAKVDVSLNPDASAGNIASLIVVTGTPAVSPSAPATPSNCLLLANIAVAAGAASIVNANITDKRVYVNMNSGVLLNLSRQGLGNNLATVGGTGDAITLTMSPAYSAYASPMVIWFKATAANTTAVTINVDGLGAKSLKRLDGATALIANDIKNGQLVCILYDGTNLQMITPSGNAPISGNTALFGDGSDGDVTISSNTSLTRDMYYNNLTINDTFALSPNGFRVFVKGTLTLSGTGNRITAIGGNGGNASTSTGGTAGAAAQTAGTLPATFAGKAGGTGGAIGSVGGNGTAGSASAFSAGVIGVAGGAGGSGGGGGGLAGSAGGAGALTATGKVNSLINATAWGDWLSGVLTQFTGSSGTGSGSGGGGGAGSVGGGGGGSGATGGIIYIAAYTVTGTANISAAAGNGGNGAAANAGSNGGGGGGGSGGSGGVVVLAYNSKVSWSGSIIVSAGSGGTAGAAGGTGGLAGTIGTAGNTGVSIQLGS
jgi:hypothetical protein